MTIEDVLKAVNAASNIKSGPAPSVPPPLILMSQSRPGLSATKIAYKVLAKKKELGLTVGNYEDGSANVNDIIILEIIKQIITAIQEDARITVVIPPGAQVTAAGGNAGGPVVTQGATITMQQGGAIIV